MKTSFNQQQVSSVCGRHLLAAGLFLVGLMACLAIGVSTAQAQAYSLKSMGVLEGMKACEPAAMNSVGQVTGTATAGQEQMAFLYYYNGKEGEMEAAGELGSRAFAINPAGLIVGDAYFSMPISHAALFKSGEAVDLGVLKGQVFSRANGINATRQVVGFSGLKRDSDEGRAFIWTAGTGMIDIGTLGGAYAQAFAINDAGFVTGTSQVISPVSAGGTHAFIYQPLSQTERYTEPMKNLGTLGGLSSYGMAINMSNHVVGYSTLATLDGRVHAFFHGGEKMLDLGALDNEGFVYSQALAINNADQVVGVSYGPTPNVNQFAQAAFIWYRKGPGKGEVINLNNLIATMGPTKAYWLLSATAINDSGQIAASAWDYANNTVVAVLLTPVK
jgi:probable HAF family extracellular repeat protein